ncbi:MAG: hypothetical protein JOZ15_07935 [Acidobacteria bacterium]|nr:hypothetical protein [Acidobacteriota bacterium]
MRKSPKPIRLLRETLLMLERPGLADVAAGATNSCNSYCINSVCETRCYSICTNKCCIP